MSEYRTDMPVFHHWYLQWMLKVMAEDEGGVNSLNSGMLENALELGKHRSYHWKGEGYYGCSVVEVDPEFVKCFDDDGVSLD